MKLFIEGDRLEPEFSDISGQWGVIWLRAGSKNHEINYATIKNGSLGILLDSIGSNSTPTLIIKNTPLYNHTNYGILGRQTNISGENIVINNIGQSALACTIGVTYNFTHSTFANYWNSGLRQSPTVLVNIFYTSIENNAEIIVPNNLIEANFTNCIIYGNSNIELILNKVDGATFNYNFKNNLMKFDDYNNIYIDISEYDFTDMTHFENNILNEEPNFKSPYKNELIIGQESAGNNNANNLGASQVPLDILGVSRITPPDIGAYQHIIFDK